MPVPFKKNKKKVSLWLHFDSSVLKCGTSAEFQQYSLKCGTINICGRTLGQLMKIRDSPGGCRTVGNYAS